MGKQEFINKLRAALDGRISQAQITEHVNYYTDYINSQIRMGKREEEVLRSLGNPRLIAKSIIDASGQRNEYSGAYQDSGYRNNAYQNSSHQSTSYQGQHVYQQNSRQNEEDSRGSKIPGWLHGIGIVLLVILGLGLVFSVLSFFAPLIFVMVVVIFLVKLFRDWLN